MNNRKYQATLSIDAGEILLSIYEQRNGNDTIERYAAVYRLGTQCPRSILQQTSSMKQ